MEYEVKQKRTDKKQPADVFRACFNSAKRRVKKDNKKYVEAVALHTAFMYYYLMERRILHAFKETEARLNGVIFCGVSVDDVAKEVHDFRMIIEGNQAMYKKLLRTKL